MCAALTNWRVQPLNFLAAAFRSCAAQNLAVLVALILSFSPVAGLRPVRAARLPTANVPRPVSGKRPSLRTPVWINSTRRSSMIRAWGLGLGDFGCSSQVFYQITFLHIIPRKHREGY